MKEKVLVINDSSSSMEKKINDELAQGWKIRDTQLETVRDLVYNSLKYQGIVYLIRDNNER